MNKEQVSSTCIVAELKAKSLRQKTWGKGDTSNPITVARADVSLAAPVNNQSKLYCLFCKRPNHDLNNCNNLAKWIKEQKDKRHEEYLARQLTSSNSKPVKSSSKLLAKAPSKAGHTTVVELDDLFSDNNNLVESEFKILGAAAVASLLDQMSRTHQTNFNLDLGCSVSMNPFFSTINSPAVNSTPVRLANSTLVRSTHSGCSIIPLGVDMMVKTLVRPNLHEPLLSVAALCDEGLLVCFNNTACRIFKTSNLAIQGTEVGTGYRKGNLFYLPSVADVRLPSAFSSVNSVSSSVPIPPGLHFDPTLLGYHNLLSLIGL
jgi:hypothetical protein